MVIDQLTAEAGENGWPVGEERPVLLAMFGREPSDAAFIRKHGMANRRAAAADWIRAVPGNQIGRNHGERDRCLRNRFKVKAFPGYLRPEG